MQRQIGEKFEFGKIILEVQEGIGCDKCFFRKAIGSEECWSIYLTRKKLGHCSSKHRTDRKSILFKKIGEVNDEIN